MSQINIHNYEAYLLDFSEGNLSEEMQMELELFLIQHPELGIDLNELSLMNVELEPVSFNEKEKLKKTELDLVSETEFINYIEGLSSNKEKLHVEKSCASNPKLNKELTLYKNTITKADLSVVYENKEGLKRQANVIWLNINARSFAAAASILFVLGLIFLWPKQEITNTKIAVINHDTTIKPHSEEVILRENSMIANNEQKNIIQEKKSGEAYKINSNKIGTLNKESLAKESATHSNITNNKVPEITNVENKSPLLKEEIALNTSEINPNLKNNSVVTVITENDEEPITGVAAKKKKGIWSIAEKALKNLNSLGVKSVNGETENSENETAYALTVGGLSITHKKPAENL